MKPTKNRTFCASINRVKMLFETKEKADNFINFNAVEIAENNSYAPIRSYYCPSCGGWHVTHKPLDEEYTRTDDLQQKAYELNRFITYIKKDFDEKEWMVWQARIEEAYKWVDELDHLPEHHISLKETRRQLQHYSRLVDSCVRKEQKKKTRLFQQMSAKRKSLCDSIRYGMQILDINGCMENATRLHELMQRPEFERTEDKIKDYCNRLVACFVDQDLYGKLNWIVLTLIERTKDAGHISTEEMNNTITRMNTYLCEMTEKQIHRHILEPLQEGVIRLTRLSHKKNISNAQSEVKDSTFSIRKPLQDSCTTVKNHFIEAVTAIEKNDKATALSYLYTADECMKSIPVSAEKMELMKFFVQIAGHCGI